jgi:type IV pilus assembly protein PilA
MLKTIKQRLGRDDEQGFTLIELMVVVLIIAILLAIAIPTFLGARNTANARAAQSNDRNALTAEQTQWTNGNQTFSNVVATMQGIEPNLGWTGLGATPPAATTVSTTPGNSVLVTIDGISATAPGSYWVELTSMGKDNNCWSILQVNQAFGTAGTSGALAGTYYNKSASSGGSCTAPAVPNTGVGPASGSAGAQAANATWYQSF